MTSPTQYRSSSDVVKPWWAAPQVQIFGRATNRRGEPRGRSYNSPLRAGPSASRWRERMTDHCVPGLHADWPTGAVWATWEYATAAQGQSGMARVAKRSKGPWGRTTINLRRPTIRHGPPLFVSLSLSLLHAHSAGYTQVESATRCDNWHRMFYCMHI